MNIKNKIVIITGASSGIGLSTAKLLTEKGAKVALVARSKEKLIKLSKSLPSSLVIQADMSKKVDIKRMIKETYKHYGRIDVLINNAGRGYDSLIEKIDIKKYRQLFELDTIGPLIAMQEAIPIMRKQEGGTIVNISSGTSLMYLPNMSAYSSLKCALNALTLTAREELKNDHIVVSVVYPYMTKTNFEKNTWKEKSELIPTEEDNYDKLPPFDSAEHVAKKILEVIKTGNPQQYAHDWMKNLLRK